MARSRASKIQRAQSEANHETEPTSQEPRMDTHKLVPLLFVLLPACADTSSEPLLAPDQVTEQRTEGGHAFATDAAMTNFMILPAAALGVSATDFGGRCSEPAVWIAVFRIEGQIPNVGDVWGSASHCAYKENPDDPTELPTYEDGQGWLRAANGDDVSLEYGNGTNFPVEGGLMAFRDEWRFTGGTGRFQNVTGSGIDYGEYDPADIMNPDPATRFPYRMSGTLDYDAADVGRAANFRGTFRFSLTFPYLAAGTPTEDPCSQENPGQWTTVMEGEGTATHLGPFTTYAEFCYNWQAGEGEPRIHHGVTASGATFEWVCDDMQAELPLAFFVPGLERVYAMRTHEVLTGLSGHLEGWGVEINGAGSVMPAWQPTAAGPVPAYPWWAELDMAGTWVRK
jgi:hypothetical protein